MLRFWDLGTGSDKFAAALQVDSGRQQICTTVCAQTGHSPTLPTRQCNTSPHNAAYKLFLLCEST